SLIFLHFRGGSSRTFTQTVGHLSPFFTISIDFRGWGSSTGPASPQAYSICHLAEDIEALLHILAVKSFIIIGHSMGGKVAQLIAGRNRTPGLKAVVLIAPAPPTPLVLPTEMKQQQLTAYSSPESAEFVARNVLSSSELDDDTIRMLVQDMKMGSEFAQRAWPEYAMGEDVTEEARNIRVLVLIIAAELDKIEPEDRLRVEVQGNIEAAEMVIVKGSGHLLPVEAPEDVGRHIKEFIQKVVM
ncbi:hypothetical protein GALMADRAFT_77488, partial [Galerina marginata CBS 339.88]